MLGLRKHPILVGFRKKPRGKASCSPIPGIGFMGKFGKEALGVSADHEDLSIASNTLVKTPTLSASSVDRGIWTVVALKGEIDISNAPLLTGALMGLVEGGAHHILLDLSPLKFLDSTGISMLVAVRRKVIEVEGELAVAAAQPTVLKVLDLCGISRHLTMFADLASALSHADQTLPKS